MTGVLKNSSSVSASPHPYWVPSYSLNIIPIGESARPLPLGDRVGSFSIFRMSLLCLARTPSAIWPIILSTITGWDRLNSSTSLKEMKAQLVKFLLKTSAILVPSSSLPFSKNEFSPMYSPLAFLPRRTPVRPPTLASISP